MKWNVLWESRKKGILKECINKNEKGEWPRGFSSIFSVCLKINYTVIESAWCRGTYRLSNDCLRGLFGSVWVRGVLLPACV